METSPTTIAPLLLRNILTAIFLFADRSLRSLSERYRLLQLLRSLLISAFLFCLRLLPSLAPSPPHHRRFNRSSKHRHHHHRKPEDFHFPTAGGDSGISRALSQILSIVNEIPVSSRKYEVVRSLAEKLIEDNLVEGYESLREVNRTVLSAAFASTLNLLETAVIAQERGGGGGGGDGDGGGDGIDGTRIGGGYCYKLNRVVRAVRYCGDIAWTRFGKSREELNRSGGSAEKFAAEALWLAQKLADCGFAEEAVCRWALASNLASLALSSEPRLQGSLVKVSAFLFKQAKVLGTEEEVEESKKEEQRQTRMKMLMSWLPLLCRASNGTDAPVLSVNERAELEKVLEEIIETLEQEEEQEKVLSLWLHHFTHCPSSDWPNLHACYARWCTASRKLLLLH